MIGSTHCLVDRSRCPSCFAYSESEYVDFTRAHLCAEYSNFITVTLNGLLAKMRLCGVLKTQTTSC